MYPCTVATASTQQKSRSGVPLARTVVGRHHDPILLGGNIEGTLHCRGGASSARGTLSARGHRGARERREDVHNVAVHKLLALPHQQLCRRQLCERVGGVGVASALRDDARDGAAVVGNCWVCAVLLYQCAADGGVACRCEVHQRRAAVAILQSKGWMSQFARAVGLCVSSR